MFIRPMRSHAGASHYWAGYRHGEGIAVKQIRISKHHRPASWALEPLPADPRDPDIVRAKQLARRSRPPGDATRARGAEPDRGGGRHA